MIAGAALREAYIQTTITTRHDTVDHLLHLLHRVGRQWCPPQRRCCHRRQPSRAHRLLQLRHVEQQRRGKHADHLLGRGARLGLCHRVLHDRLEVLAGHGHGRDGRGGEGGELRVEAGGNHLESGGVETTTRSLP